MKTICFLLLATINAFSATCPIELHSNSVPFGDFGAQKVGSSSDPKSYAVMCTGADVNTVTVTLAGPFTFLDGSQTKTIQVSYDNMGSPKAIQHFRVIFTPADAGEATGTMTVTALAGTRIMNDIPNPLPLRGTGQ